MIVIINNIPFSDMEGAGASALLFAFSTILHSKLNSKVFTC